MLLGARQFFERRGGGWQNPYVTDGLVAMWDGEWNAGGGVHDAAAESWVNLVGPTGNLTVTGYSDGWASDHFKLLGSNAHFASGNVPFSVPDSFSFDFCCAVHSTSTPGRFWGFNLRNGNVNYSDLCLATFDATRHYCYRGLGIVVTGYTLGQMNPTLDVITTSTFTRASGTSKVYMQAAETLSMNGTLGSNYGQIFSIGGGFDWKYGVVADVYCLRVYSRAITAKEISDNYAIDKERFKLP